MHRVYLTSQEIPRTRFKRFHVKRPIGINDSQKFIGSSLRLSMYFYMLIGRFTISLGFHSTFQSLLPSLILDNLNSSLTRTKFSFPWSNFHYNLPPPLECHFINSLVKTLKLTPQQFGLIGATNRSHFIIKSIIMLPFLMTEIC